MTRLFEGNYKPFSHTTLSTKEIRSHVEEEQLQLFDVSAETITTKENLVHAIAKVGGFYTPFPLNWDALSDALCDLPIEKKGYVWLFPQWKLSEENETILKEIFADAADFWATKDRVLWVFVV